MIAEFIKPQHTTLAPLACNSQDEMLESQAVQRISEARGMVIDGPYRPQGQVDDIDRLTQFWYPFFNGIDNTIEFQ